MQDNQWIYAFGQKPNGKTVLIVGLTIHSLDTLKSKHTLTLQDLPVPANNVTDVVIFFEETKEELKATLKRTGIATETL